MGFSFAQVHDALADAYGERDALVWRGRATSWSELRDRTNRFARVLATHGIGLRHDPDAGEPWESPHDHVGLYLHNGDAYLTAMVGAWRARAAGVNVNYRYVADELVGVLGDARVAAIVYHGCFAERVAEVVDRLDPTPLLVRVDDGSGDELLDGAIDFTAGLDAVDEPGPPRNDWSPSDRYILYTGGTTGSPKGVLWRQDDIMVRALGLTRADGTPFDRLDEIVERAERRGHLRSMPLPPFMHGAAHWNALSTWLSGGTVVLPDVVDRFDPADALRAADEHAATSLLIVGDAFARPLIDALEAGAPAPPTLRHVLSSGAILSRPLASALQRLLPGVCILDVLGSSESGRQGMQVTEPDGTAPAHFTRDATSTVLAEDRSHALQPGHDGVGWLATAGRVPLGYLGDPAKTAATFPVVDGVRYSVPGDRARLAADGSIELFGRDSSVINSGGEKIFAEEVERALKEHPAVHDVLVVGRPSERWGQAVAAVVALRPGSAATPDELTHVAAERVARYKLPKSFTFVTEIPRSPSGKPDYRAARALL